VEHVVYTNDMNELISVLMMVIIYSLICIYILRRTKMSLFMHLLFFISVALRVSLTMIDTYFFYLPHSGADSVKFELQAYNLLIGYLDINEYNFDNYPKLIYYIYLLIGRKPLFIRAINGCLSLITGLLVYKSIFKITDDNKKSSWGMLFFLLFPQSMIFSSIILRESLIVFFATFSVWSFIEYTYNNKTSNLYLSFISLLIGSLFHCGIILIAIAYLLFIFIEKRNSTKKIILLLSVVVILLLVIINKDIFLRKFSIISSLEDFYNWLNYVNTLQAGSGYLNNFSINTIIDLIIYVPFKIIYFLFSPMIWDIRGLQDIIAILFDVVFYMILISIVTKAFFYKGIARKNDIIIKILIIATVLVIGAYSMGTIAAGTAIRHRYKVLSLLLIIVFSQQSVFGTMKTKHSGT
jgi:4-amino-4-deoxy-L-arabinose transferase-like glycosyltransferase